jgi:hypothetical protein
MAEPAKFIIRQRDFSAGELDEYAERSDEPLVRAGGRQMSNWRIMTTRAMEYRCGREALFPERGRIDEIDVASDTTYRFCFGQGTLKIRNSSNVIVAGAAGLPWQVSTAGQISWALIHRNVVICFPGMRPVVCQWDGDVTWTIGDYTFATDGAGIEKVPFARIAKRGITMNVSAITGTVNLTFSAAVLTANHVGSLIKWANRRLRVATVTSGLAGTGVWLETGLIVQRLTVTAGTAAGFSVDEAVTGSVTETEGVVVEIDDANNYVYVQLLNYRSGFTTSDTLIGPFQRTALTAAATSTPRATTVWDEQVFGDAYGWPQSCNQDVSRLIFCDIPSLPEALCESAINLFDDFDVTGEASGAIVELITGEPRIYHVMGGSDQFVFTSRGVYYIPISESNPLVNGSVTFRRITSDAASTVRPVETAEGLAFVNSGGNRVIGIVPTGQTAQPYVADDLAEWHSHLFSNPSAIVATTGDGEFPERYLMVLNDDGTIAVGRFDPRKKWWGWLPWSAGNSGLFQWVTSRAGTVLFTVKYTIDGADLYMVERMDKDAYLDAQVSLNSVPAALQAQIEPVLEYHATGGTAFGDMTSGGGLTALDDGDTTKTAALGASRAGTSSYYGRLMAVAQPIKQATVYASSDAGYSDTAASITFELRASNTAPNSDGSDGTLLKTLSAIDTNAGSVTLISTDSTTDYLYHWVRISDATAGNIYAALVTFQHPGAILEASGGGTGDLWFFAGATNLQVMLGLLNYGTRSVDADGDLTLGEGDSFAGAQIVGFPYSAAFEPFIPHAGEGQSGGQTTRKRQIGAWAVKVQKSNGFNMNMIEDGSAAANPTIIGAYEQGDDQGAAPAQREGVYIKQPRGSAFDPRTLLTKNTPGTLRVLETGFEISV